MNDLQTVTIYNIFQCIFPGCNENIPVETFLSRYCYSTGTGISCLRKEGLDVGYDLIAIDVICPFCNQKNSFRVIDRIREISRQEFNAQRHTVTNNSSIPDAYKVKTTLPRLPWEYQI